jgi:hypothetical protein
LKLPWSAGNSATAAGDQAFMVKSLVQMPVGRWLLRGVGYGRKVPSTMNGSVARRPDAPVHQQIEDHRR